MDYARRAVQELGPITVLDEVNATIFLEAYLTIKNQS